jgi:hypothetical protein
VDDIWAIAKNKHEEDAITMARNEITRPPHPTSQGNYINKNHQTINQQTTKQSTKH